MSRCFSYGLTTLVLTLASTAPAVSVHVDFQLEAASGVTAPGYTAIDWRPSWVSPPPFVGPVALGNGIRGAWTSTYYHGDGSDRGTADPLLRDYLFAGTAIDVFQMRGLPAGDYDITFYSVVAGTSADTSTDFALEGNNDGQPDAVLTVHRLLGETRTSGTVTVSSAGILSFTFLSSPGGIGFGYCNGFDLVGIAAGDVTPPAAITDLAVTGTAVASATLHWTAPADPDDPQAAHYDLRYSSSPIDESSFAAATQVSLPAPGAAGSPETFIVTGLAASTQYYFAIKSADAAGNVSALSNVATGTTPAVDVTPPAAITDLSVTGTTSSSASLRWTAPSDVDSPVSSYDLRYATWPITAANFAAAGQALGVPAPAAPGTQEAFTVSGLAANTLYYFAVKSADASNNVSGLSNVSSGQTATANRTPVAHVDFQLDAVNGVAAPGYTAVDWRASWVSPPSFVGPVDLGNHIQGAWTASYYFGDGHDTGTADPLLRDYLFGGTSSDTFQLRGLRPGDYEITFYSVIPGSSSNTSTDFTLDGNNDGQSDSTITVQRLLGETSKTGSVTVSSAGILLFSFIAAPGNPGFGVCNGFDLVTTSPVAPPAAITDLAASLAGTKIDRAHKVNLAWTAPADDNGTWGNVASYDIRYAAAPVSEATWDVSTQVSGEPAPSLAGHRDSMTVTGLDAGTTYYFAIKSRNFTGNISPLSNVATIMTGAADVTPPAAVSDLAAAAIGPNWVRLAWTAPADPDDPQADHYELRYSTVPIDEANWASATAVSGLAAPKAPGSAETFTVHGLLASTQYYFAIRSYDLWGNRSALSNAAAPTTLAPDTLPPLAITDLRVAATHIRTAFLTWTAPADQGTAGCGAYDVRYATSEITEASWASATQVDCPLTAAAPGTREQFAVPGLQADTTYYFAIKTLDQAEPPNVSVASNSPSGTTMLPIVPVTVHNPWIANDRVADCRTLATIVATFDKAYTPDGVIVPDPADIQTRAINEYDNFKRRLYHWGLMPPNSRDVVEQFNVFGWALCGSHASMNSCILNAMGIHARTIAVSNGAHTIYEVNYNSAWHTLDTMTTYYVWSRTTPRYIVSMAEVETDKNLVYNAVAEGRACPGFLLCGDTPQFFADGADTWVIVGDPGAASTSKSMNMDLRMNESISRTWESWANQYTDYSTTPPYHHEANKDWKDTVNRPYWEPYQLTSAQSAAVNISMIPTYRRWANGTLTIAPDFRSAGYQADLAGSTNIATFNDDGQTPDLHVSALNSPAEAIFHIVTPFLITDANIAGTFVRANSSDVNRIYASSNGTAWTQVWDNSVTGTTQLAGLNIRSQVTQKYEFWVKVMLQAGGAKTDAGVTGFTITTVFEHNKGGMPYLDKGLNNITVTFDNASELQASRNVLHVVYTWKEYDGSDWTIEKSSERFITTSPSTFSITTSGAKVPRTESILMEVTAPPMPDSTPPAPIATLAVAGVDSTKVDLAWTATGDDWDAGQATSYDIRYSTSPVTDATWDAATVVANPPSPKIAGSAEAFTVTGLQSSTTYYFAVKASDEGGNASPLSNVVPATTLPPDVTPPAGIVNLIARASRTGGAVDLTWTASGDDGNVGTAARYDLRYSTSPIDDTSFAAATLVAGVPAPQPAGSAESFTVTGLTGGTQYCFALKIIDDANNVSGLSNCAPARASSLGEKVLQYGLNGYTGTKDNYADASGPTVPYGDRERMRICGYADSGLTSRQRGFIQFDVSCIPAGTTITKATLWLYAYDASALRGSTGFYGLYPLTRSWDERTSCWNLAGTGVSWISPGGDFLPTPDGTSPKQAVAGVWYPFDVTARVQSWLAGASTNYGWCLRVTDENVHDQDCFYALDTSNAALRPKMVISDLPVEEDLIAPAAVTNMAGSDRGDATIQLTWTATGDDGMVGTAWRYDLRYTTYDEGPINEANWNSLAHLVGGVPQPQVAGSAEGFIVTGLTAGQGYYFGLKVQDEAGNTSDLSNVADVWLARASRTVVLEASKDGPMYGTVCGGSTNRGAGGRYELQIGGGDTVDGVLMQFDLLDLVGVEERVASASLDLYSVRQEAGIVWDLNLRAYPLLDYWAEGTGTTGGDVGSSGSPWGPVMVGDAVYSYRQVTAVAPEPLWGNYDCATVGVPWAVPGARGIGTDVSDALMVSQHVAGVGHVQGQKLFTLTLTDTGVTVVNEWARGIRTNYGFSLFPLSTGTGAVAAGTHEYATAASRTKLILTVVPSPAGDVNGDGHVDVVDLLYLVDTFGKVAGELGFNRACDFNRDDSIDVVDLLTMVENFGT